MLAAPNPKVNNLISFVVQDLVPLYLDNSPYISPKTRTVKYILVLINIILNFFALADWLSKVCQFHQCCKVNEFLKEYMEGYEVIIKIHDEKLGWQLQRYGYKNDKE